MSNLLSSFENLSLEARERAKEALLELETRRVTTSPWRFIALYPKTQDELDQNAPYKHFPRLRYLKVLVELLRESRVLICVKSRQMMVTWLVTAFNLWDAMFHAGRRIFFQSEDQDKANAMLARLMVLFNSLPEWLRKKNPVKSSASRVEFLRTHSEVVAIPQGGDALRMFTASRVWSDETASQKYCAESYKATLPTIKGKDGTFGQAVYTSTPKESWFELLAHDQLESETPPPTLWNKKPCPGVTVCELGKSRYIRVDLHYTADPSKRTPKWLEETHRGISDEDWQQEYELNWKVKSGKQALAMFRKHQSRIVIPPFEIPEWWPRWGCADYGSTNPYSFHAYTVNPDGVIYAYWEYYSPGPLGLHLDAIKAFPDFARLEAYVLDRSCWAEDQQVSTSVGGQTLHQVRSIAEMHQDHGVYPIPAARVNDVVKIEAFEAVWSGLDEGSEPRFKIFSTCEKMIWELPGIRWKPQTYLQKLISNESVKLIDKDNHAFDDASYSLLHRASGCEAPSPDMTPSEAASKQARELRAKDVERMEIQRQEEQEMSWEDDW